MLRKICKGLQTPAKRFINAFHPSEILLLYIKASAVIPMPIAK